MEIVELEKRESDKTQKYHPRLPAVELIVVIGDCAHDEFNSRLGKQQRVCREYAADASVCHALDEPHTVRLAGVYSSEKESAEHDEGNDEEGSDEPNQKLVTAEKEEKLVQVVGRLSYRAEYADKECTKRDEQCTNERVSGERLA
jgi:hypothetical protein